MRTVHLLTVSRLGGGRAGWGGFDWVKVMKYPSDGIGRSKGGGQGCVNPKYEIVPFSCRFRQTLQNNRLAHPRFEWTPISRKTKICHWGNSPNFEAQGKLNQEPKRVVLAIPQNGRLSCKKLKDLTFLHEWTTTDVYHLRH